MELILGSHVSWIRLSLARSFIDLFLVLVLVLFVCSTATSTNLPPNGRPVNDRKTTKASTGFVLTNNIRPIFHLAWSHMRVREHTCVHTYTHVPSLPAGIRRVKRLEPRFRVPRIFVFAIHSTFALVFAR